MEFPCASLARILFTNLIPVAWLHRARRRYVSQSVSATDLHSGIMEDIRIIKPSPLAPPPSSRYAYDSAARVWLVSLGSASRFPRRDLGNCAFFRSPFRDIGLSLSLSVRRGSVPTFPRLQFCAERKIKKPSVRRSGGPSLLKRTRLVAVSPPPSPPPPAPTANRDCTFATTLHLRFLSPFLSYLLSPPRQVFKSSSLSSLTPPLLLRFRSMDPTWIQHGSRVENQDCFLIYQVTTDVSEHRSIEISMDN